MRAETKIKFKIIKTRVNARLGFRLLYGNGLANNFKLKLALSTMEAEYIDLSQSMRDLIPVREMITEFISWSSRKSLLQDVLIIPKHLLKQSKTVFIISCLLRKWSLSTVCKDAKSISSH